MPELGRYTTKTAAPWPHRCWASHELGFAVGKMREREMLEKCGLIAPIAPLQLKLSLVGVPSSSECLRPSLPLKNTIIAAGPIAKQRSHGGGEIGRCLRWWLHDRSSLETTCFTSGCVRFSIILSPFFKSKHQLSVPLPEIMSFFSPNFNPNQ